MSCKLTYDQIDGLQAVYMENELLRIGLLPGRGSDIFEFTFKPKSLDFLLRLKKGIRNPARSFSQVRSTTNQFEDYYYGGWQVCLPNSPAFNYRGAELGQHGEVSLIPWTMFVEMETKEKLQVSCETRPLRIPLRINRTFSLENGSSSLKITETVTNESGTWLDIMWGQHIAFGLPFLEEGVNIETNAGDFTAEAGMPQPRLYTPASHQSRSDASGKWPLIETETGTVDASKIPPAGTAKYSDLAYLEGYPEDAYYKITNVSREVGFCLRWNGELFKTLWLWQERNATTTFPWWGDCYTVALEPWTSPWTPDPNSAIQKGEWLKIEAGETITTHLEASAFETKPNEK